MNVTDAMACLGASRVIWIDDEFDENAVDLARMLIHNIELTRDCDFPGIREIVEHFDQFQDTAEQDIKERLDRDPDAANRIRDEFLRKLGERQTHQPDLSRAAIERVCALLNIGKDDRLPFDRADAALPALCEGSADEGNLYIVDLNDAVSNDGDRGLDVLVQLDQLKSRGTVFLLTRETDTNREAEKEAELRRKLKDRIDHGDALAIPTCVIARERLLDEDDGKAVEEALLVAIKRAGLRRSVHEVLRKAQTLLKNSFLGAAESLTRIAPERLDEYVVKTGYEEGVSELHVIERALTAHIARDVRHLFGTDTQVRASNERVRSLRGIELRSDGTKLDKDLVDFRNAETWETDVLINSAFAPLACGDVFEIDETEQRINKGTAKRFVLLAQPCDIQIRPTGEREVRTAILAPLKYKEGRTRGQEASRDKLKECVLRCTLDGKTVVCDLRSATSVNLSILDLATFREDGRVRRDKGQEKPKALLPGQENIYQDRTAWLAEVIADFEADGSENPANKTDASKTVGTSDTAAPDKPAVQGVVAMSGDVSGAAVAFGDGADEVQRQRAERKARNAEKKAGGRARAEVERIALKPRDEAEKKAKISRRLQLAFASPEQFKVIEVGMPETATRTEDGASISLPIRVTWFLRRVGRIRMPYAADLLDRYVGMISRSAFDVDFVEHGFDVEIDAPGAR